MSLRFFSDLQKILKTSVFHQHFIHASKSTETLSRCVSYEIHLKFTNVHREIYTVIQLCKRWQPKGKL